MSWRTTGNQHERLLKITESTSQPNTRRTAASHGSDAWIRRDVHADGNWDSRTCLDNLHIYGKMAVATSASCGSSKIVDEPIGAGVGRRTPLSAQRGMKHL